MSDRVRKLMTTNYFVYFMGMIAFSIAVYFVSIPFGISATVVTVLLFILLRKIDERRENQLLQYLDTVTGGLSDAGHSSLLDVPLPVMVYSATTGEIVWANDSFVALSGKGVGLFNQKVSEAVEGYDGHWAREGRSVCPNTIHWNKRDYQVVGNLVRSKDSKRYMLVSTYWLDITDKQNLAKQFENTRPVVAVVMVDNYEEVTKVTSEAAKSILIAQIDSILNEWVTTTTGMLCRYDRNRSLFILEQSDYNKLVDDGFSVLDKVHSVVNEDGVNATLSIGVARGSENFAEAFQDANLAIEMALSRGGDQAVVKAPKDFEFYGGHNKAAEKRTKVKSRVMANTLAQLIAESQQVYIMGHHYADMDSLGAAAGIYCICRKKGKKAKIVLDEENNASKQLLANLKEQKEYEGVFISGEEAFLQAKSGSLLVVVDTNNPENVESPQLLEACQRVAIIDHHRRAATYIEDAALNFHEPYASSTSELVSELMQYILESGEVLHAEANALMAGIVLDTKNFTLRAGGRTFEAAAYLRRAGADTIEIHHYFQNTIEMVSNRYDIISQARLYHDDVALVVMEHTVDRIIAAQAADEMLNIENVRAALVAYPIGDNKIQISGRSMGEINVQVILEELGGGGTITSAAAIMKNTTITQAQERILAAVDHYFAL